MNTWTIPLRRDNADPRLTDGMQDFFCPACSRVIIRPPGTSSWCPCGTNIPHDLPVTPAHFLGISLYLKETP